MSRRLQQKPITNLARERDCLIRLPAICNGDPATTVPCHFRLSTLSGMSFIPDPLFIAFGCSACHAYVDTHKDDKTQLAFAHGVFRTQAVLIAEGAIVW